MDFLDEFRHLKIGLEEIKSATNNFGDNNVIGSGGFGKVYKGAISHSKGRSMAAFKRLDGRHGQGNSEFWKEIMMLSRYTHESLVSLLGYCDEHGEKILVYEYASHGSLDHHLSSHTLTWAQRLKICLAAARGLSYLHDHQGTHQRVLHRDIKSANILLCENWNAKISDLGLSKVGPANQQHTVLVTNVVGTPGYIDPLYMETYRLTKESDVYSFGVVLFEVLCGRLCFRFSEGDWENFVPLWKQSYEQKKLAEIIFPNLMQQINSSSLETFSNIACQCLQRFRHKRPTMALVVEKLEIALKHQMKYEKRMGYEDVIKAALPPLIYSSVEELETLLSKGIFLRGQTWFSINKKREHIEMISAAECLTPSADNSYPYFHDENSRFSGGYIAHNGIFIVHVRTQFLSPETRYSVNLVFKFLTKRWSNIKIKDTTLKYKLGMKTESRMSCLAHKREDGWIIELFQFTSDSKTHEFRILFEGIGSDEDLIIEGIEFRPAMKMEHGALEEGKLDMQPISNSAAQGNQKRKKGRDREKRIAK